MFRKRLNSGKNFRRKRNGDGYQGKVGDGDEDYTTGVAIRKAMKKQKILASLPLTSTGTISKINHLSGNSIGVDHSPSGQIPSRATSTIVGPSAELSFLASKHVSNMEAFIERRMSSTQSTTLALHSNQSGSSSKTKQKTRINANGTRTEEDLYRQLAQEVTDSGYHDKSGDNISQHKQQQQQNEGDQGDGGAALLVGTGIAEVILPTATRRHVATPTNCTVWNKNSALLSSAVPEKERHKHTLPSTTPKPFVKFRKPTNNLLQNNDKDKFVGSSSNNKSGHNDMEGSPEQNQITSSTTRKGFDAFRGKACAPEYSNRGNYDNKNCMGKNVRKTGKDRDDQVYAHFLKNALNGKNR